MHTHPLAFITPADIFRAHKKLVTEDSEEFVLHEGTWNLGGDSNQHTYVVSRDRGDGDVYDLIIQGQYALLLINASGTRESANFERPEEELTWIPLAYRHLLKFAHTTRLSDGSMYLTSAWDSHHIESFDAYAWVSHFGETDIKSASARILRPAFEVLGINI